VKSQLRLQEFDLGPLVCPRSGVDSEIFGPKTKGNTGDRGKKLFIAAIAFFLSVSLLKKSQKNSFGDRFSLTPVVGKWCPALYMNKVVIFVPAPDQMFRDYLITADSVI
jgi:hypothetical protein